MSEVELFRRVAGDNLLRQWLENQRTEAIKYLVNAVDPMGIHRAQGKVQLIERQLDLLEKAKTLR